MAEESTMYRFQIFAYDEERETSDNMPFLNKVTEIWFFSQNAVAALAEARMIIKTKHYHIRRIDKIIQLPNPTPIPTVTPGQGIMPTI